MDTIYSLTLGASILAAAVSFLAGLGFRARLALTAAIGAISLLIVSVLVHFVFGHRPGSEQALGFASFFREHPAFAGVAVSSCMLLLWVRRRLSSP